MLKRDIKMPIEPKTPNVTQPLFEENQEWNEYYEKKRQYDHDMQLYYTKLEILEKFDSMKKVMGDCFSSKDRDSIVIKLEKAGIPLEAAKVDEYLAAYFAEMKRLNEQRNNLKQVLKNIEIAESKDTVGISFLNDKLKVEQRLESQFTEPVEVTRRFVEQATMQTVINGYTNSDFGKMQNVYESLKELGYNGDFGELAKFIPAFEQIAQLQSRNTDLQSENKNLKDEKKLLLTSNSELQEENSQLRDENTHLNQRIEQIMQNVKKYKDFVLETVKNMPVIGKMMAKKIQKDEKRLGDGVER